MGQTEARPHLEALCAELGAALAARKAALEFERSLAALDEKDGLGRQLHELRFAEAVLAGAKTPGGEAKLPALAQSCADDLERAALAAFNALDRRSQERPALLLTVSVLVRSARLREARIQAHTDAERQGRRLEGFDDAIASSSETEQLQLALRRFRSLMERDGAWDPRDVELLYLRALSAPGRLRLEAAGLRSDAQNFAGTPLPPGLGEAIAPFLSLGLSARQSVAWAEAGLSAEECVEWREAGLKRPDQALAWYCHGFAPAEAAAWAKAGLLPDESGAFVFCGASELEQALELRQALGDVEHLLSWKRAGFEAPRVLELLAQGVHTPDQALAQGRGGSELSAVPAEAPVLVPQAAVEPAALPVAAPAPVPLEAPAMVAAPPVEPGAWLAWGAPLPAGKAPGEKLRLSEEGGLRLALVQASELKLPLGASLAPSSVVAESEWEKLLGQEGAWYLNALGPQQALLTWGMVCEAAEAPWADAVDHVPGEPWFKRWARKTEEWGEEGAVSPCRVGRVADGLWWIGFKQSQVLAEPGSAPQKVVPAWPTAAWREAFEDFCLKMEIPRQAPHWLLLTSKDVVK